jgi:hypothetical protein
MIVFIALGSDLGNVEIHASLLNTLNTNEKIISHLT